jgi:predicted Zn-dependent peptidase
MNVLHFSQRAILLIFLMLPFHCNALYDLLYEPFYVHEYHLENGLSVYLSVNRKEPIVKTSILVNVGSAEDPDDATGLAHYLEHLMFKGTSKIGTTNFAKEKPLLDQIQNLYEDYRQTTNESERKQIYAKIDAISLEAAKFVIPNEFSRMHSLLGITDSNAFTSNDRTYYVATVPSNQIKNFLQLELERFKDPVFRTFHTELESVFEERNLRVTDLYSNLFKQYHSIMFPSHPYGDKSPIGTDEHLKNPSIKKIQKFYEDNYIPSNIAICMSGDMDPDEVIGEIKKTFGSLTSKIPPKKLEIPIHKPLEAESKITINSNKKLFIFGIKIPKVSPSVLADAQTLSLLLSNGSNGLLDESLYYSQKASSVSVSITEWKDYFVLNIWVEPNKTLTLSETKSLLLSAFQKIEKEEIADETFQSIKTNQRLNLLKQKDDNDYRLQEMSEAFLSNWSYDLILKKFQSVNQSKISDLSHIVKEYVNKNIVSIETISGKSNFVYINKPPISKLQFSDDEESRFKKDFSYEPSDSISPEFADFSQIQSKIYPNGNQIIHQKNKQNALFQFKMIIEQGAWISPYLAISVDYWKHLGTDLYTAGALSTKFYLLGSSINIQTNGEALEITMEGEDEHFVSSFRLLEHSIKSVASSKEVWENHVDNYLHNLDLMKEDEREIDSALHEYALYGQNSLRSFQASKSDLKQFKSSEAISILGSLLKYKSKITYYGNLDFDTLESTVLQEYTKLTTTIDPSHLSKKQYRSSKESTFFVLSRNRPHVELNYFSPVFPSDRLDQAYFSIYNSLYNGLTSPFFVAMREQTGNAYSANVYLSYPQFTKEPVIWFVNLACQADKLANCLQDANQSLESPNITNLRFEEAKLSAIQSTNTIRKSNIYLIDEFIRAQRLELSEDPDQLSYERLTEIQWKDFVDFTKKIKDLSSFQISVIGDPKKMNRQVLRSLGKVEGLTEAKVLGK